MRIVVKFFAILREQAGVSSAVEDMPQGTTVGQAVQRIFAAHNLNRAGGGAGRRIAYAVNLSYCDPDTILHDGDELALIPPVSGG